MSQKGNNKYIDGSIVVNDGVVSRDVTADRINGIPTNQYLTGRNIPNPDTLKNFVEIDGGLIWKGVKLVPPNNTMEDRPYTEDEITSMVEALWDEHAGTNPGPDDTVDPSKPGGSTSTDWDKQGGGING